MSVRIVLAVREGPNDALTTSHETKELPLGPWLLGSFAPGAQDRIECSARCQTGRGRMDGGEPERMSIRYVFYSDWRNGGAHFWRFNAWTRRHQPAQEQLNQQHQH
ncbi:hypothetical protein QTH87_09340 [Variovorax sp. J22P168]|nr:hypothetical protein [Variovorax sp. J22P168]